MFGVHPGSFRKSGKQKAYRIRNLEEDTEDGRYRNTRMGEDGQSKRGEAERTDGVGLRGSAESGAKSHKPCYHKALILSIADLLVLASA